MTIHASRRDVLKGGGALVVSFSLAGAPGEALAQGAKPLALTEVDSFLAIARAAIFPTLRARLAHPAHVARLCPRW